MSLLQAVPGVSADLALRDDRQYLKTLFVLGNDLRQGHQVNRKRVDAGKDTSKPHIYLLKGVTSTESIRFPHHFDLIPENLVVMAQPIRSGLEALQYILDAL